MVLVAIELVGLLWFISKSRNPQKIGVISEKVLFEIYHHMSG
jgi:hypothetical protein